jgi:GNAT superfamily N-acetyltransferase
MTQSNTPTPRQLKPKEYPAALAFCVSCGADGVLAGQRIADAINQPIITGEAWVLERWQGERRPRKLVPEQIDSLAWASGSLMLVGAGARAGRAFAPLAQARGPRYTSVVGDWQAVGAIWDLLSGLWPTPKAYRQRQLLLEISRPAVIAADPLVRAARGDELDALEGASRAMFTEELGFAPPGPPEAYRRQVADQIVRRNLLCRRDAVSGEVLFKAELGAACGTRVQIQGVWTNPRWRGLGYGKAGMAAVIAEALRRGYNQVCLYVNDFNYPALAVYRALGFSRVGTWGTVMF